MCHDLSSFLPADYLFMYFSLTEFTDRSQPSIVVPDDPACQTRDRHRTISPERGEVISPLTSDHLINPSVKTETYSKNETADAKIDSNRQSSVNKNIEGEANVDEEKLCDYHYAMSEKLTTQDKPDTREELVNQDVRLELVSQGTAVVKRTELSFVAHQLDTVLEESRGTSESERSLKAGKLYYLLTGC